jgi:iron complex transport system ATP-binding protein
MKDAFVEIHRLSCTLGGKGILRDVSVAVEKGEYISIVGPNGSGKTTLLKCLVRIVKNRQGRITIAGKDLDRYRQRDLARLIAYVPQADGHSSPFTVREFVTMARYPYLSPFSTAGARDREAVRSALGATGTEHLADGLLTALSGGERQKVFIAAALAQEAPVMLLDEPTSFLDPKHAGDIMLLLGRIHADLGVTIVVVTHDVNRAVLAGGRVMALKDGVLVFSGEPQAFMNEDTLRDVYDTEFHFVEHPVTGNRLIVPAVGR